MEVPLNKSTTLQDLIENIFHGEDNKVITVLNNEPNIKTKENMNILAKAAVEADSKDILVNLLEHGLKVTDALDIVITIDKDEFLDVVLNEVTDRKIKKYVLNEGLYFAVKANKKHIIANLLIQGANINTNQREKNTPLHMAIIEKSEVDIIKYLISNGANTKIPNKKNKTASDLVNTFLENSDNNQLERDKLEQIKHLLFDKDYECLTGGPSVLRGFSYQIKFLTLYIIHNTKLAISSDLKYELSTEARDLIPFDDIHLRKTQGGQTRCEFVQVKQGKVEPHKFFAILKNDKNMKEHIKGNDSIVKLFIKFCNIVDNLEFNNTLNEFIYCINGKFHNKSYTCFTPANKVNNDLLCGVKRDRWIIDPHYLFIEVKYVMLNLIATSPYLTTMTEEFKNELNEQIKILDNLINENIINFDINKLWNMKIIAEKGLNCIREYLDRCRKENNIAIDFKLKSLLGLFKKESIEKEWYSDKDIFLFFSKYDESEIKNKIDKFVKHFHVFTNCPSSDELDEIIKNEIEGEFKVAIPRLITAFCIQFVSKWISNFNNGKLQLFTTSDGEKLFNDLKTEIFNALNTNYTKKLQRSNICFQETNNEVINFLTSNNHKVLHIITKNTRLHTIRIIQTLKTIKNLDQRNIFCINLGHTLNLVDNYKIFFDVFSSNKMNDFLILECSDEAEQFHIKVLNGLRNIIRANTRKKLIIIGGNQHKFIKEFKNFTNDYISCNSALTFKDLTKESQTVIINTDVSFKNNPNSVEIPLKMRDFITMSTACEVIDENILSYIITNVQFIKIADQKAFITDEYNYELFIPRKILKDSLITKNINKKIYPQDVKDKIVIVANNAGEGKSTMLTHLAHCMRNKSQNYWIIRIDLRNYADNKNPDSLNSILYSADDTINAVEHITRMVVETKSTDANNIIERKLLRETLIKSKRIGVILFIDGFDEISPGYKEKTCIMLKALSKSDVTQLWVTTRVHLKEYLEKQLEVTSYTLESLTETDQVQFLCKFWKFHLKNNDCVNEAIEDDNNLGILEQRRVLLHNFKYITNYKSFEKTDNKEQWNLLTIQNLVDDEIRLQSLAKRSLKLWEMSMKNNDFLKFPLHLEMLAKNLMRREWKLLHSRNLELFEIYTEFIQNKLEIYYERSSTRRGNQHAMDQANIAMVLFRKMHREIAVRTLFEPSFLQVLPDLNVCKEHSNYLEVITRAGLVKSYGNIIGFIHRTFAEYYFSEYLATHLEHPEAQWAFLINILLKDEFHLVRIFFDRFLLQQRLLLQSDQLQPIEKQRYIFDNILAPKLIKKIEKIMKKTNYENDLLKIAVCESHVEIYLLIFNNISKSAFVNLITQKNHQELSILHLCIHTGHVDMFRTIVESIKELKIPLNIFLKTLKINQIKRHDLTNSAKERSVLRNVLMDCDNFENTILHKSAAYGQYDIFEIIIKAAKSCSVLDKLITKINEKKRTALHLAARNGNLDIIQIILKTLEENSELRKDIISQADKNGQTALHTAISDNRLMVSELILKTAEKYDDVFKDLMMKRDGEGRTAVHAAVSDPEKNLISIFLLKTIEKRKDSSLNKYLITQLDIHGKTLLDLVENPGRDEICNLILKIKATSVIQNT